jgi:hypothetical protein
VNQTWSVEMFVYLATALSALLLLPKSANWRLRLAIGTIGMQALAQSVSQMRINHPFWQSRLGTVAGTVELFGGALALTTIYLLKRENVARKSTDARLRLSESNERPLHAPPPPSPSSLRKLMDAQTAADSPMNGTQPSHPKALEEQAAVGDAQANSHGSYHPKRLRKTRRFPVSLLSRVTRLDGEKIVIDCEIVDLSQGGARLCSAQQIPAGALLKIEFRDCLFLGEVCRCEEIEGIYFAGVRFEHMIDLAQLARILREIGFEQRVASGSARLGTATPMQSKAG